MILWLKRFLFKTYIHILTNIKIGNFKSINDDLINKKINFYSKIWIHHLSYVRNHHLIIHISLIHLHFNIFMFLIIFIIIFKHFNIYYPLPVFHFHIQKHNHKIKTSDCFSFMIEFCLHKVIKLHKVRQHTES